MSSKRSVDNTFLFGVLILVLGSLLLLGVSFAGGTATQTQQRRDLSAVANEEGPSNSGDNNQRSDQSGQPAQRAVDAIENARLLRERRFEVWSYTASRKDSDLRSPLRATVNYKHEAVADILAYAKANQALHTEVANQGGQLEVAVTFVYPVEADWFRAFAKENGFQVQTAQIRIGAPGTSGSGTMSISGTADDPLPQENIDNVAMGFFSNSMGGVFGAYGTVDAQKLGQMASEPRVFLVDVTPAWVRHDLARNGFDVDKDMQEPVTVDLPYGWMERLGLENFTTLELPTPPPPVSTFVPVTIPPAPDN